MTVLEAIQKSAEFLGRKQVESARLQTELLLAHLLRMPRMKLYLNFDRVLSPAEIDGLRELVRRRGQREPCQHITGSTSFCGHEIKVSREVLIPRPETEQLAEMGWQFLETEKLRMAKAATEAGPVRALDLGTGSGCIAIALAAHSRDSLVVATDISNTALELARANAESNGVAGQIEFRQGDGFAALAAEQENHANGSAPNLESKGDLNGSATKFETFNLIISNPPYIASEEIETLEPEVRDFDPRLALDGGVDGLEFYRRLAQEAARYLKPEGKLMVEFGEGQAPEIRKIFENKLWVVEGVTADYSRRERILTAIPTHRPTKT